jgi:predicted dehydrogenase
MKKLRIGFIGCGEAVQLLHLPTLRELPHLFEVAAFHDVSATVMAGLVSLWPSSRAVVQQQDLLDDPTVDAVVIANPNAWHADTAMAAMQRGKHVLIEKPVCVTLREADLLLQAEQRYGVTAQVGYMRRYAPAFTQAAQLIAQHQSPIHLVRVRDVIGPNAAYVASTTGRSVIRASDIAQSVMDEGTRKLSASYQEAIGTDSGALARVFRMMLGLASHDTSAMRELVGAPKSVLYAQQSQGGTWLTAALDHGDFVTHLEVGLDQLPRMDAHIEVCLPKEIITVKFDSPYIRHQATQLKRTQIHGEHGISESTAFETRRDAFALEWEAFHAHIMQGTKPKCSILDAQADLELFLNMVESIRQTDTRA